MLNEKSQQLYQYTVEMLREYFSEYEKQGMTLAFYKSFIKFYHFMGLNFGIKTDKAEIKRCAKMHHLFLGENKSWQISNYNEIGAELERALPEIVTLIYPSDNESNQPKIEKIVGFCDQVLLNKNLIDGAESKNPNYGFLCDDVYTENCHLPPAVIEKCLEDILFILLHGYRLYLLPFKSDYSANWLPQNAASVRAATNRLYLALLKSGNRITPDQVDEAIEESENFQELSEQQQELDILSNLNYIARIILFARILNKGECLLRETLKMQQKLLHY